MFGRKAKKATIEVTKLSSLIADNVVVVGDVLFSGGLRIDGRVEGNVLGKPGEKSLVVLSRKGCVIGRVRAFDAVVNGSISGDLEVEHFLELQAGARVSGNIIYRQLQMECGATIDGKLVRRDDLDSFSAVGEDNPPPETAAPPAAAGVRSVRGRSSGGESGAAETAAPAVFRSQGGTTASRSAELSTKS